MRAALTLLIVLLALPVSAQEWQVRTFGAVSTSAFDEPCRRASGGLPDGCVARGSGDVRQAWYTLPTTRYAHAILGDAIEAGGLQVRLANGAQATLTLPDNLVFEDRTPRLADLDGDGRTEIITLRASNRRGGQIAVYGIRGQSITELGATPFIGRANRWLNVAGIADFLGRGDSQVAFVETPHIGGTLKLATFSGSSMQVVASARGFSNHEIRSREQRLSAVVDVNGDGTVDLALPDARRTSLQIVSFAGGRIQRLASIPLPSPVRRAILSEGSAGSTRFVTGLANGSVVNIGR